MKFYLPVEKVLPSQLYLSEKKLAQLRDFKPREEIVLPIQKIEDKIFLTDGHHRAYLMAKAGVELLPVEWDLDELPMDVYETCLGWCQESDVRTVLDLTLLSESEYEEKWIKRCERIGENHG